MHFCRNIFFATILAGALIQPVCSTAQPMQQSLLVVTVPGLSLKDLSDSISLSRLVATGKIGLMNTSSAVKKSLPASYLTMSAGMKASWPSKKNISGYQTLETINGIKSGEIYRRYTGYDPAHAAIVVPDIQAIITANADKLEPGLLAETLAVKGVPFLFIGNQDSPTEISRPGVFLAMNKKGTLSDGYIDERTYLTSQSSPAFYSTNYTFFYDKTKEFLETHTGIIFLDLGDLARLDKLYDNLPTEVYEADRNRILGDIGSFTAKLLELEQLYGYDLLLITPYPDKSSQLSGNTLAPVILRTSDSSPGLLSSASTKRPGLITNLDIAPTILDMAGINTTDDFIGAPAYALKNADPPAFLISLQHTSLDNYLLRPALLKSYVIFQIIVVLTTVILLLLRHPFLPFVRPFLLSLEILPLFFLIAPIIGPQGLFATAIFLIAAASVSTILLEKSAGLIKRLAIVCLLTSFCIVADLLVGAPLMKSSLLGYCPISGARYYGLGNEYMGVLLGSSIIGSTLLMEIVKHKKTLHAFVVSFIILTYLVAAPQWGTNVGGAIAFLCSFTLLVLLIYQIKLGPKSLTIALFGILAILLALFYFDFTRPQAEQSHIGLTARLIKKGGLSALLPIIIRKVAMNIKLLNYSLWTRVLITFLGAAALLFYRPPGVMRQIFDEYTFFKSGFITGIAASAIALLANDSGIVAAATCMIYVLVTPLYLATYRIPLGVKA